MEFRPCIDIHNGKVKQIVGSSLKDEGDFAVENFVSERDASYYAELYKKDGLKGGHIILLNKYVSEYYEATKAQAFSALSVFPDGFQIGGGISDSNAQEFLDAGASHVIVTSFVFSGGRIDMENLERMRRAVGREHLVLDLSCRRRDDGRYYIVTDRWQKFTDTPLDDEILELLFEYADEYLIHAVDVEGKSSGIDEELVRILSRHDNIPITYAGGIRDIGDLDRLYMLSGGRINATIGSALDIFGGPLNYREIVDKVKKR